MAVIDRRRRIDSSVWTPHAVRLRIQEAVSVYRRMRVRGMYPATYTSSMPDYVRETIESYGYDKVKVRPAIPSGNEIDRADETVMWLLRIRQPAQAILWCRGNRIRWRILADRVGLSISRCKQIEDYTLSGIAVRLNTIAVPLRLPLLRT